MKIMIGANIKHLRAEKGVTQEQLAEAMGVSCAAVSKWERNETYPDITLLQPLAFFFDKTLDELIGYDKERIEKEIDNIIAKYCREAQNDLERARQTIEDAYRIYPNDYRIMYYYMWSRGVYDAEPNLDTVLMYKDEFSQICDKIIGGCTDGRLRLGAWKMKGILLHAEGKTNEALKIHSEKCGSWWNSFEQMNEQLFKKDRPEFLYWARRNMYELAEFAADKLVKSYFFNFEISYETMIAKVESLGDELYQLGYAQKEAYLIIQSQSIYRRLHNDLKHRKSRGGTLEDIIRILEKCLASTALLDEIAKKDVPLQHALVKEHGTDDLLSYIIDCFLSSKNACNVELLENESYRAVIEKYKRKTTKH